MERTLVPFYLPKDKFDAELEKRSADGWRPSRFVREDPRPHGAMVTGFWVREEPCK